MPKFGFGIRLEQEFNARRVRNPRYSLRAFAAFLGVDHSTLSQILRSHRPVPARLIRAAATKLGLDREEAAAYIAAEQVPDSSQSAREEQLRHWTAEAMSIVTQRAHWEIVRLSRTPDFRPDCRWIAKQAGVSVDDVNLALSRLLRLGLIATHTSGKWTGPTQPPPATEAEFRNLALARIREKQSPGGSIPWQTQSLNSRFYRRLPKKPRVFTPDCLDGP